MTDHVDVLIIGAGLSGIGAAAQLTREHPGRIVRGPRAARGQRRHVGPLPLPGHPLRLRHVHPRLPLQAVARRQGAGRRRRRSSPTCARPRASTASTSTSATATHARAASWDSDTATWTVTVEHADGESSEITCHFLWASTGYYDYERGLHARLPRAEDFQRPGHPPAALARGPRLRRQAGRRDRLRCHRRHAGPGAGRVGRRPRDDAAALPDVHPLAARRGPGRAAACSKVLPTRLAYAGDPVEERRRLDRPLPAAAGAGRG